MSRYRSTSVHIDESRDRGGPGPQRWDREKFENFRRGPPQEDIHIDIARAPRRSSVMLEERRPPPRRYEEEFFYEDDRYGPPSRRRMDFMDEPIPAEVANRALAPYRREPAPPPVRRPARPTMLRRQSSLDTFDRQPIYRGDYRLPSDVPIPLPIRRPAPPKYYDEYEEYSYRDMPARPREHEVDEYREVKVKRERRSRSRAPPAPRSASSSSSESSFEEVAAPEPPKIGKKGKTRMPKRLVHKKAVIDMSLPFEEEDDFIIVQRALTKEHIDSIIEKSKTYKEEKTVFKYTEDRSGTEVEEEKEEKKSEKAETVKAESAKAESAKAESVKAESVKGSVKEEIVTKKTTIIEGGPPPPPGSVRAPSPTPTVKSHKSHKSTKSHHTAAPPPPPPPPAGSVHESVHEEKIETSHSIPGPLAVLSPSNRRMDEYEIRQEIKALEAERRALKLEREADLIRTGVREEDYEIIERIDRWEEPRSRSRARSRRTRSRAPNPKAVALAMGVLS